MTSILDRFVQPGFRSFRPRTLPDLFALRLAQKLNDVAAVAHYVQLVAENSEEKVLYAFGRAAATPGTSGMAHRFHEFIERNGGGHGVSSSDVRTAAFKCERRSIAVAAYVGDRLDYTQVRQLSSTEDRASASVVGFVNFVVTNLEIESAAVELSTAGAEVRRSQLTDTIIQTVRENSLPIWNVSKRELLEAFGHPALKSRKELRAVVRSIWPALGAGNGKNQILDAAAVGMFVQIERQFMFNADLL
jgi:hypothetical protein